MNAAPVPVVIDTDPGIDDAVALALALRSLELDVCAVTTTYGNASLGHTTRNARALLHLAGRPDVPVHPGADRPLTRPPLPPSERHGPAGIGYASVPTHLRTGRPTDDRTDRDPAPDTGALLRALSALPPSRHPAALLTLGPLTNLAHALLADADLVRARVGRHVAMLGNLPDPSAPSGLPSARPDFNAWADPEAAAAVLAAQLPSDLVGLQVTGAFLLTATEVRAMTRRSDPLVRWLTDAMRFAVDVRRERDGVDGCPLHDVVAVAALARPHLLAFGVRRLKIGVAEESPDRGRTIVAPDGHPVRVAQRARLGEIRRLLDRVGGGEQDRPTGGR